MEKHQIESSYFRILEIYDLITRGEKIEKKKLASDFKVSEKSIQRDMAKIRNYLEYKHFGSTISYDRQTHKHQLNREGVEMLSDRDIFAVCKILLDSRAFSRAEMNQILDHLLKLAYDRKLIEGYVENERHYYIPVRHGETLIDKIWFFSQCIKNQSVMSVEYEKQDGTLKAYKINPLGLLFNEYYFYVIGQINERENPISLVFRLDRFKNYSMVEESHFKIEYSKKFKEGEFRQRIQFMYTGELITIRFKFSGDSLEAVLDRLPTAVEEKSDDGETIIKAEVYGEGVKRWLLSQGDWVEVISPPSYRQEMIEMIERMRVKYEGE